MKRSLQPRAPVVIRPSAVSQLNSLEVLGIDARRFLELVVPRCAHVSSVGKLRVVSIDDADEALRSLSIASTDTPTDAGAADDGEDGEDGPQTPDAFLAALGRRRTR